MIQPERDVPIYVAGVMGCFAAMLAACWMWNRTVAHRESAVGPDLTDSFAAHGTRLLVFLSIASLFAYFLLLGGRYPGGVSAVLPRRSARNDGDRRTADAAASRLRRVCLPAA